MPASQVIAWIVAVAKTRCINLQSFAEIVTMFVLLSLLSMASAAMIQMDWKSPMPHIGDDLKALQSGLPIVVWVRETPSPWCSTHLVTISTALETFATTQLA
jgi:hypothetical protein